MPANTENRVLILGTNPESWNEVKKALTASFNQVTIEKTNSPDGLPGRAKRELPSAIIIFKTEYEASLITTCLQRLRNTASTAAIPTVFVISQPVDMPSIASAAEYDVCGIVSHSCISETLPQVIANAWNSSKNSASMRPLIEKLSLAVASNSISEMDETARELYFKFPQEITAQMEYASSCIRNGDWGSATKLVDEAFKKDPKNPRVANARIRILLKEKDYAGARILLDQIELLSPKNASRLAFMSDIHVSTGNKAAARKSLDEALTIADNNRDARISMAELDITEGMMTDALTILRDTATQDEMASFFNDLGVLAVHEGRFQDGHNLYSSALTVLRKKSLRAKILFNTGLAFFKSDKSSEAIRAFEQSIAEDAKSSKSQEALTWLHSHSGSSLSDILGKFGEESMDSNSDPLGQQMNPVNMDDTEDSFSDTKKARPLGKVISLKGPSK